MATESEWFIALLKRVAIGPGMCREWATDLLAMGPHGPYVESDPWERTLIGSISFLHEDVYFAGSVISSLGADESSMWAAQYLLGEVSSARMPEEEARLMSWETFDWMNARAHVLAPLWVRSGEGIVENIRLITNANARRIAMDVAWDELRSLAAVTFDEEFIRDIGLEEEYDLWISMTGFYEEIATLRSLLEGVAEAAPNAYEEFSEELRSELSTRFRRDVLELERR